MDKVYLYKITNLITNQIYIGKTIDPKRRESDYRYLKCKEQKLLYKSIKHYGWNNHIFESFCCCIKEISSDLEIYFIRYYNSYYPDNKEFGLNYSRGGDNPPIMRGKDNPMFGKKHTQETKDKISKLKLGKASPLKGTKITDIVLLEKMKQIGILKSKKIIQLTKTNIFIQEWDSIKEAKRKLNIDESTIIKVCKGIPGNHTAGGFKWKYLTNT